jgi:hypothetical protein
MADFIQQDQRLVDAVVRYGKQYIPSMPVAEQGGAAIGLVGTFGTGAALKGLQAIKASENLSGLFNKFSDAVSRAQMPIGLELQAGRLYPDGYGFDITGNSRSSILEHQARPEIDSVITYDSIPNDLGYRFMDWLENN